MSPAPLVELLDVGMIYANGMAALAGATFAIAPGEFVSLLGPSGCGKSTALRLIAGLSQPTSGTIRRTLPAPARGGGPVACVFQDPTLLPWATVWSNAWLPLRIAGVDRRRARERVDAALARVGLADVADAYPSELSGGMRMRASLARALVTDPRLLLLDEPLAALDEISRSALNDELLGLWRAQRWGALFITHSVYEAVYLSTRVLVMSGRPGRIVADIPVNLPEHRSPGIRLSREFLDLCAQASAALREPGANLAERPAGANQAVGTPA
ncbi:MAG TPA: ABC transporter ATP-binding protein [Lacipirellulaceae bacterium]|nr:ABC transporter ATP-binding protein [Lacipirellulaceae bacterium]